MSESWLDALRELHDAGMRSGTDWDARVQRLNARIGLSGRDEFALPTAGLPPPLFVGNIEALRPREWVLVISLNQARREEDEVWHQAQRYTNQSYWDHWRFLNRDWWSPRFYRPLARLASSALGVPCDLTTEAEFATTRMIFVELCPYSSREFQLDHVALARAAEDDPGFQRASVVRRLLIDEAQPAVILVNGTAALANLEQLDRERVDLEEHRYASASRPSHSLWHKDGAYRTDREPIPVMGFPFLRKPSTHNSYVEIEQLAGMARALIAGHRPSA